MLFRSRYRREFFLGLSFPFFLLSLVLFWALPRRVRLSFSKFMGKLSPKMNKKGMQTAYDNLTFAYGSTKSDAERWEMARESFSSFTRSMIDFFATGYILNKKKFFSFIEVTGEEHLRDALDRG